MTERTQQLEVVLRDLAHYSCREWIPGCSEYCNAPAEFLLWGKLIPAEGLGPRCYDCAAKHVHYSYLLPNSDAAVIDLRPALKVLAEGE